MVRGEVFRRILSNQVRKLFERIQATIDRESRIAGKISDRIEKIKSQGGNVTESEGFLTEAKSHITEAQSILNSLKEASTTVAQIIEQGRNSSTTARDLSKTRGIVSEIERHLKLAHSLMVKAVANLRGMSDKVKATTTPNTN
jgi:nanoRNase/pAp phosphatase (c-di-AMP/oligoRNAs hydrolase)